MFCVPMTYHFKCKVCNRHFKKTVGDCIGPFSLDFKCPYCGNSEVKTVEKDNVVSQLKKNLNFL